MIDLHKRMMTLWRAAWDEHLVFRRDANPPFAPDVMWDLMRRAAKIVLEQCDHPARIPSAPPTEDSTADDPHATACDRPANHSGRALPLLPAPRHRT